MISLIILLGSVMAFIYHLEAQGRNAAENEAMKQELDDIKKANAVRDGLDRDAAAAKRVRDEFTR